MKREQQPVLAMLIYVWMNSLEPGDKVYGKYSVVKNVKMSEMYILLDIKAITHSP